MTRKSPPRRGGLALLLLHLVSTAVAPLAHALESAGAPPPVTHVESEDFEGCPARHAEHACVVCRAGHSPFGCGSADRTMAILAAPLAAPLLVADAATPRTFELYRPTAPRGPPHS